MPTSKLRLVLIVAAVALIWIGLRSSVISDLGSEGFRPESDSEALATLRVIEGHVEVAADGDAYKPVATEVELSAGAGVRTGPDALAEIEYFDGSLTRVGRSTFYSIGELRRESDRTVIVGKIDLGETFHDVKELTGSNSRFEVQESNAIAGVRATRFAARCLPPLPCGIAVVEGVVEVTPSSGEPVSVGAGRRVTIDDNGLLGEVTEVSPDDPWLNRNQDLDEPT